jgi:hypothetical protein
MDAHTRAEFRNVTSSIDHLTQGLNLVVDTLSIISEQIRQIHAATTADRPPSDLAEAMNNFSSNMNTFVTALERQGERIDRINAAMAALPAEIETATKNGTIRGLEFVISDDQPDDAETQ